MALGNTSSSFGIITRLLHWATALAVLIALPMGIWLANSEVSLSMLKYFGYHKTLGIVILTLTILRVLWHQVSAPPAPLSHRAQWQDLFARSVHQAMYVLLLLLPLSGRVAISATGIDTVIFGRWTLPAIALVSETWEQVGFQIHGAAGYALALLLGLHLGAALFRAFVKKDGTLRRMLA
ncbi:MAG: cytochrome b [Tateyamaria sp.]